MKDLKLAEEIADKYSHYGKLHDGTDCFVLEYIDATKAMEQYAQQTFEGRLREELMKFRTFCKLNYNTIIVCEDIWIDEYLKRRKNEQNKR